MRRLMIILTMVLPLTLEGCEALSNIGFTGLTIDPVRGEIGVSVGGVDLRAGIPRLMPRPAEVEVPSHPDV